MKTIFRTLASLLPVLVLLGGCSGEKNIEPVAVGEMEVYKDPGIGFQISHPKGWVVNAEVGRATFYNAPDVDKKFRDPRGIGALGVESRRLSPRTSTTRLRESAPASASRRRSRIAWPSCAGWRSSMWANRDASVGQP